MKKAVLCILDGWGCAPSSEHNAITLAHTPNYDKLLESCPNSQLNASSSAVGLPVGQMGNSEVGHVTIGTGRIILQDLPRISQSFQNEEFFKNTDYSKLISSGKTCHVIGLISDGGVHSHIDHIIQVCKNLTMNSIPFHLHAITDGRDTPPQSALKYLAKLQENNIHPTSICGRFYAMDRDIRWDRTEKFYQLLKTKNGKSFSDPVMAINSEYENGIFDEFLTPMYHKNFEGIQTGDSVIMMNFRADRMRQISEALFKPNFNFFEIDNAIFDRQLSLTCYSEDISKYLTPLFPHIVPKNSLGEVFANLGLKQLRIAETEKYAHVTYFLNGGREEVFVGEDRVMVASPKVATYDLKPEMSAKEITVKLLKSIEFGQYDFICVNFANADMVGHSGAIAPTKLAIETIDECLGQIIQKTKLHSYEMLVTADHGNAECLFDEQGGQPLTSHTLNPVPLIYVGDKILKLSNGGLCDIAATLLELMGIEKPQEMTGASLIYNCLDNGKNKP